MSDAKGFENPMYPSYRVHYSKILSQKKLYAENWQKVLIFLG